MKREWIPRLLAGVVAGTVMFSLTRAFGDIAGFLLGCAFAAIIGLASGLLHIWWRDRGWPV